jgi:broad specificity phosphatase PhoE
MVSHPFKVVFARHGATDWNVEQRFLGHTDLPLNELGRSQAKELGYGIANFTFDAIYSSDLRRAYDTATLAQEVIYEKTGKHHSITTDSRLREIHFGSIEGLTYEEAAAQYPEKMNQWYQRAESMPPPGGEESLTQVRDRVITFMNELALKNYGQVLIVSHGGAIRSWISHIQQKPFWEVSIKHGQWIEYEMKEERE